MTTPQEWFFLNGGGPSRVTFRITTGGTQVWYSRRSGDMIGVLESGILDLGHGVIINRIRHRSANDFSMNKAAGGIDFSAWQALYPNHTIQIETINGTVTIDGATMFDNAGGGFIDWNLTDAQETILDPVGSNEEVEFTIHLQ